ncbi:MopE-related protein [Myxococcota bacterium]
MRWIRDRFGQGCAVSILAMVVSGVCQSPAEACTVGGAMKAATTDGRPILWQNEDLKSRHVTLRKYTGGSHDVMEVLSNGSNPWNGLNSQGLIHGTNWLPGLGGGDGDLVAVVRHLQRECATISNVRNYLDARPNQDIREGFLFMDKNGEVAEFEVAPSDYWEYHPENPTRQQQSHYQSPKLFVVRTNIAFQDDNHQELDSVIATWPEGSSKFRYQTARDRFTETITNTDKLTLEEVLTTARWGNPGYDSPSISSAGGSWETVWGTITLGVKAGEDPKFSTMFVALGQPDYSIYIPVWTVLSQAELSERVTSWNDSNIGWWAFKLFDDHFDGTDDYDNYIHSVLDDVETNIIAATKAARESWLDAGRTTRFHDEARMLHRWSGWAAHRAITSAYDTAGANGRSCNLPPEITTLAPELDGLTVTFHCDATDPDGDGISEVFWEFGDGTASGATTELTVAHTYSAAGTYLVVCYAKDGRSTPSANLRFEYVTVSVASCGDTHCNGEEDCQSCPSDCGACCGDGTCTPAYTEDCESCPADCPTGAGEVCCSGTLHDGDCCESSDCTSPDTCEDYLCTSPLCGDTTCNGEEDCLSCPDDCGECCGDSVCNAVHGEDCDTCPSDCPTAGDEVCCSGVLHSGDCCDNQDCSAPDTCVGWSCLPPSTCESDADGDHYGVGASCAGPDCDDADPAIHPGASERCNGVDDDCDETIDDDWPELGNACSAGVGQCEASGTMLCTIDGRDAMCDASPGSPEAERCGDEIDNDCDGLVDEDCDGEVIIGGCQAFPCDMTAQAVVAMLLLLGCAGTRKGSRALR